MTTNLNGIDIDSQNVVSFTMNVGDRVKLCAPANYPPVVFPTNDDSYDPIYYLNGFIVVDQSLGEFEGTPDGSNMCVYYRHNSSGRQIIQYSSEALGQVTFYAILEGIVVHDHASIPQGGPAFATYWSETRTEE